MIPDYQHLEKVCSEATPGLEWFADMDRYILVGHPPGSSFINDQVTLALCATGEHAGRLVAYLAEVQPATVQALLTELRETKAERARNLTASLRLALEAVDRCRELLIIADAEADDLAEYDAAAEGLRMTLVDWLYAQPAGRAALQHAQPQTMQGDTCTPLAGSGSSPPNSEPTQ